MRWLTGTRGGDWGGAPRILLLVAFAAALPSCSERPADPAAILEAQTLGLNFLQRGQLPQAEEQFTRLIDLAPRDPAGHANLGVTYLRGGRMEEAERELRRARRLAPANTDVNLALARLYALTQRADEARRTLDELLKGGTDSARVLYAMAQLNAADSSAAGRAQYEERLREVIRHEPANIAVRLKLAEVLARRGDRDSLLYHLEQARRLPPEPPAEARESLTRAIRSLQSGSAVEAREPVARFIRLMEVTAQYQASLEKVDWLEARLIGRPVITLAPESVIERRRGGLPEPQLVRFVDATSEVGLQSADVTQRATGATALVSADLSGDGTISVLASFGGSAEGAGRTALYRFRGGEFVEVPDAAGIALPGAAVFAGFADLTNDGRLDALVIGADGSVRLFAGTEADRFDDVTARTGFPAGSARARRDAGKALFVDIDHDGDLDVVLLGGPQLLVFRNNLDGTFTESAAAMGIAGPASARDGAFADFDDDGRIDLIVASDRETVLYRNAGARRFTDATTASGLRPNSGGASVSVADYDNDGRLDLFVGGPPPQATLWRNRGRGLFERDARSATALAAIGLAEPRAAAFVDFDNDGWVDLAVAGAAGAGERGMVLLKNDEGTFRDASAALPPSARSAGVIATADVQRDGDVDLLLAGPSGLQFLRNDGGNARLSARIELIALRTGSGKNNTHGIGATIELRAGELYQTRVVTSPVTHFGLGSHLKTDVIRVQWPNGVPQVAYFPGTDADVLEAEQLKGSCAFLYTWDGTGFRFVTDVMWRSALGMPLGIMGAARGTQWAPAGASQEYLRIPDGMLRPRNGRYVLQITEELWETAYLDDIRLLAVDHPDSVQVFVDERFVPPAPVQLRTVHATRVRPLVSARTGAGEDVLPALRARDNVYVSGLLPLEFQGLVEEHDLILDLGPEAGAPGTRLFLHGWIYPTDASINVALAQQSRVQLRMPALEVRDARGNWKTAMGNIGFPSGKDKTIVIELDEIFPTTDHRVRIRTNMQIYWDHAFVASHAADAPVRVTRLAPAAADLHYRGFSRMYRKGSRYGPHWFAYEDVSRESPWRTIEGAFTRFGDVLPLLQDGDDRYVIMGPGDETTLEFDAAAAPPLPDGWTRTFLLYTDGWIKDADMNTAHGNTVEPLPFHAIRSYPYAPGESYPADSTLERYRSEYNTRIVRRR